MSAGPQTLVSQWRSTRSFAACDSPPNRSYAEPDLMRNFFAAVLTKGAISCSNGIGSELSRNRYRILALMTTAPEQVVSASCNPSRRVSSPTQEALLTQVERNSSRAGVPEGHSQADPKSSSTNERSPFAICSHSRSTRWSTTSTSVSRHTRNARTLDVRRAWLRGRRFWRRHLRGAEFPVHLAQRLRSCCSRGSPRTLFNFGTQCLH